MNERMDAPNGKRIVELLRKAAVGGYECEKGKVMDNLAQLIGCYGAMDYRTIDKLADMVEEAIQHEHESAYDAGYDAGFASADDWCAQHEDEMEKHGWYRALAADKATIRIGDKVDSDHHEDGTVMGIQFYEMPRGIRTLVAVRPDGWDVSTWHTPDDYRHRAHTVENVLREFAQKMNENMGMYTGEAIDADEWRQADSKTIAEYAARLQLAGDAE